MKGLVYQGPRQLEYKEVPTPRPKNGEALIDVSYVGICGSDMHAYFGHDERRPPPLILGHEVAGVQVGGKDDGRRVIVNPLVSCNKCQACLAGRDNICAQREIISMPPREGGFADYVLLPSRNLITVPENVPLEKAVLCEPIACGWHAVRLCREKLDSPRFEQAEALVLGGGAIGFGAVLSLRAQGLERIRVCESSSRRRAFLEGVLDVQVVSPESQDSFFDLVIDGVGFASTREMASRYVKPGGMIAHIGLGSPKDGLDVRRMTLQEITFIGTYTYTAKDFCDTADALFAGKLGKLDWTETRDLKAGGEAFRDLAQGHVPFPRILLKP